MTFSDENEIKRLFEKQLFSNLPIEKRKIKLLINVDIVVEYRQMLSELPF